MRGPKPLLIELTTQQKDYLTRLVRRQKTQQRLVRRARIILLANEGHRNDQIVRILQIDRNTVTSWRKRWHSVQEHFLYAEENGVERKEYESMMEDVLTDSERSGKPAKFTPEQQVQLIALALEPPSKYGYEITNWSPKELRKEAIKQGIFESISVRHVGRFLKRSRLKTPSQRILVKPKD